MTATEQRAARMGARHKRAGQPAKDNAKWRPEVRAAYRNAYDAETGPKGRKQPTKQQQAAGRARWRDFFFNRYL